MSINAIEGIAHLLQNFLHLGIGERFPTLQVAGGVGHRRFRFSLMDVHHAKNSFLGKYFLRKLGQIGCMDGQQFVQDSDGGLIALYHRVQQERL